MHVYRQRASVAKSKLASAIRDMNEQKVTFWLVVLWSTVNNIYRDSLKAFSLAPEAQVLYGLPFTLEVPHDLKLAYHNIYELSKTCLQIIDNFKYRIVDKPSFWQAVSDLYNDITKLETINYLVPPNRHLRFIEDYIDVRSGLKLPTAVHTKFQYEPQYELRFESQYGRQWQFDNYKKAADAADRRYQHFCGLLSQLSKEQWRDQVELALDS